MRRIERETPIPTGQIGSPRKDFRWLMRSFWQLSAGHHRDCFKFRHRDAVCHRGKSPVFSIDSRLPSSRANRMDSSNAWNRFSSSDHVGISCFCDAQRSKSLACAACRVGLRPKLCAMTGHRSATLEKSERASRSIVAPLLQHCWRAQLQSPPFLGKGSCLRARISNR